MKHLTVILALALASCAGVTPDAVPGGERDLPPLADVEEAERTSRASDDSAATVTRESNDLRDRVRDLRREATEARGEVQRASSELTRLVEQKSATEIELVTLQEMFGKVRTRNMFLEEDLESAETQAETLKRAVQAHEQARGEERKAKLEALTREQEKDREIENLTAEIKTLRASNRELSLEKNRQASSASKAEGAGKVMTTILWVVGIGVVVIILAWLALTIWKPRFL